MACPSPSFRLRPRKPTRSILDPDLPTLLWPVDATPLGMVANGSSLSEEDEADPTSFLRSGLDWEVANWPNEKVDMEVARGECSGELGPARAEEGMDGVEEDAEGEVELWKVTLGECRVVVGDEADPGGEATEVDDGPLPRWMLIPNPRLRDVRRPCPNPWGLSGREGAAEGPLIEAEAVAAGREGRRMGWGGSWVAWLGEDGRRVSEPVGTGGSEAEWVGPEVVVVVEDEHVVEGSQGRWLCGRGLREEQKDSPGAGRIAVSSSRQNSFPLGAASKIRTVKHIHFTHSPSTLSSLSFLGGLGGEGPRLK